MERQDLMKKGEKLRAVLRATAAENGKVKSDSQKVLEQRERVTSMNTTSAAHQRIFEDMCRYWQ
jgi:hypothetical protein